MEKNLKVLLLEDSRTDAELIQRILKKDNENYRFFLAMDKKTFINQLEEFAPDVILSDNSLPQFSSVEALHITRRRLIHTPFILVTGTVSEDFAAEIIKMGADDYILKDRMTRLPAAIESALKRRLALKELTDYKYALDQSAIVAITDQKGIITYVNDNFCKISKYRPQELLGQDHRIINSGYHSQSLIRYMWVTIANGNIWRGEFRNRAKDGSYYWVDTTIIPFLNDKRKPYQYLSIRFDITEKMKLEDDLLEQQKNEQLRITANTLMAQERERTAIGMELHDNVNQILVGTNLKLSMVKTRPDKTDEFIASAMKNIKDAIEENRKIAHTLVTPDLKAENLANLVQYLSETMLKTAGMDAYINTEHLQETLLNDDQKLAIYRIIQEQSTNIIKYSSAHLVNISLSTSENLFKMKIEDDGKGMDAAKLTDGIGLKNIKSRLIMFNGNASFKTEEGQGFLLEVTIPLK